jgi:hypothetical protein
MADAGERHLKGVERTGADVAVNDAERGQCQKPGTARMMKVFGLIEFGLRLARNDTRHGAVDQAGRDTRWHIHMNLATKITVSALASLAFKI